MKKGLKSSPQTKSQPEKRRRKKRLQKKVSLKRKKPGKKPRRRKALKKPRKKLPRKTAEQNKALAKSYGVTGFPTVLLVEPDGKLIAKTGYKEGGPKTYVKHLEELLKDYERPAPKAAKESKSRLKPKSGLKSKSRL